MVKENGLRKACQSDMVRSSSSFVKKEGMHVSKKERKKEGKEEYAIIQCKLLCQKKKECK